MAGYDYKKEFKEFYSPKTKPSLVDIPPMNFVAVRGCGNPNDPKGEYPLAMEILYAVSYTIKMSKMGTEHIDGYFDYVVPPLEGLWEMEGMKGIDYSSKEKFKWISMIRLPEFVDKKIFDWAVAQAVAKKGIDGGKAEFFTYNEGLCVTCMHIGPYDDEPETLKKIDEFMFAEGCENGISKERMHHEIYLGDPRKIAPEKRRTVMRIPVVRK